VTQFSEEQRRAIAIERFGEDACIVAGPGSGKTTVLVERFRQLVEAGTPASRILAITFTEKAASNMRDKLAAELGPTLDSANVSTVHGFCYRLIREHAIEAGVDPGAVILDEGKGVLLRQRALEQALDQLMEQEPEAARGLMRGLCADARQLTEVYDAIRSAGKKVGDLREFPKPDTGGDRAEIAALAQEIGRLPLTPAQRAKVPPFLEWNERVQSCTTDAELRRHLQESVFPLGGAKEDLKRRVERIRELQVELLADCVSRTHARDREALIRVLERFDAIYAAEKRKRGLLDFADLEFYAVRLLETHDAIRRKLQEHFLQILMDEFQDTNGQQEKLMDLLRGPERFYAVGDINQSIFGFRYSSPEVFRQYRDRVRDAGKHHVDLVENWRSRPEILLAVETALGGKEGIEERALVAARQRPAKRAPSVEVLVAEPPSDDVDGTELEAQWVAQRMLELHGKLRVRGRLAEWGDMAVLVRNSSVFEAFAKAFEERGIPYEQSRKRGSLDAREALDLTHLLRVIANPRDELSLAVVLRSPLVQLSDEGILRLEVVAHNVAHNLGDALSRLTAADEEQFEELDGARLRQFRASLAGWRRAHPHIALDRLLLRAIDECAYPYRPGTASGNTIDKFLEMARSAAVPLQEFVQELELLREVDVGEAEQPLETGRNAVRMMTAHSAKGLEFPVVFVASMNKGTRTSTPPFSFTPEVGLGAKWKVGYDPEGQDDAYHAANCKVITAREKAEGNRLLYVAMTRAEEHLVLSYSSQRPLNWAQYVRDVAVKPFEIPLGKPTEVRVSHPDGRSFAVRVLRTAEPPGAEQSSFEWEEEGAARELPRPVLDGQYDSAVTVTALATFADCPRRYYLAHGLGWEQERPVRVAGRGEELEEPAIPASELGRDVHRLLAGEPLETNALAQQLARTFRLHSLGLRSSRSERVEREWAFQVAIEDVVVSGQIDLWFVEEGGVVLVDYKTNDIDEREAKELADAYRTQIDLYALTLGRATGLPVREAYLHFLRPDVAVRVHADPETAVRVVQELTEAQEQCRFPLRVAERCHRCQFYRGLCPAGTSKLPVNSPQLVAIQ